MSATATHNEQGGVKGRRGVKEISRKFSQYLNIPTRVFTIYEGTHTHYNRL